MSLETEINAYFVKTKSNETESEDWVKAESVLQSHVHENSIRHIKASEGYPLIASGGLTKRDVFIFDHFEGDFFKQLQQTKSLIIGPRCLLVCLLKSQPIPLGTSPVYTTAMRDLKISASGVTALEKDELSVKIQWMGGHYFQNFGRSVTHLVSNTIKSSKYEHATLNGIPVMHVDWVQRVWERSLVEFVTATDEEFDKYRLPIFFGTNVTSTGLDTSKKNEVMRLVQENGGTYHRAFRSQLVDIVITEKGKTDSDKYQAAVRYKKDILASEWIFDSVQKGFALPTKDYQVKSLKVSTPTKADQSIADFTSTDHTQLSEISRISVAGTTRRNIDITVNDTICTNMNDSQPKNDPKFLPPEAPVTAKDTSNTLQRELLKKTIDNSIQYRSILDDISPREAKKAGNFLDGFCIYLSGFRTPEKEKLNRILNSGGATRYDAINDEITHIIVGQLNDADYKAWKRDGLRTNVHIVRLDWLLESIRQKQAANENIYRVSLPTSREPDAPSPSSKKTLRSMNHSFKQPEAPPKKKLFDTNSDKPNDDISMSNDTTNMPVPRACSTELPMEEDEQELLAQYSQENMATAPLSAAKPTVPDPNPPTNSNLPTNPTPSNNTELTSCTIDYENLNVFRNLVIYVDKENFPDEFYSQLQKECEAALANIVGENFKDPVDYAVVSFERAIDVSKLHVKAKTVITELYVEACMKENKIVPIEYYHKPIPITANSEPLKGMTIVISLYAELERDYIDSLAQILGAKVNNTYSKKEQPLLVCPLPEGAKYEGALKWRFPVVTSDWLVQCAEKGEKLPLHSYLVGESSENFPTPTSVRKSSIPENPINTPKTTSTDITPLRNKRVSELALNTKSTPLSGSLTPTGNNPPDSPHTPTNTYGGAAYSLEFMERILADIDDASDRECVRGIIEEIRANPTPELERIKRQVCTPINRRVSYAPKVMSDFYNTPEFKRRMVEEFDKRWHLPTKKLKPSTPIDMIRKRVLKETCKNFGIPVSDDDDENMQNISKTSTSKTVTPITSSSRSHGTPVVHRSSSRIEPRSIFSAQTPHSSNKNNKNDSFIPNTQDENGKDIDANQFNPGRPSLVGKSTIDFDKISFEETDIGGAGPNTSSSSANTSSTVKRSSAAQQSTSKSSPDIKQITDYLKECESRRQSLRREKALEAEEEDVAKVQYLESEKLYVNTEDMVEWCDPDEFNKERLKRNQRTMQYEGTPRFSISCADETQLQDIIAKIYHLNGKVSENLVNFDPHCTHYICERPNRGEKILGCIAAGKWVLGLKYIEDCFSRDNFVNEEMYEWGNEKAFALPKISEDNQIVANAAHFWRKVLSMKDPSEAGIFYGMKAILRIGQRTLDSLSNVIKAGKGETITATSPYNKSKGSNLATHCFVDMKKMPLQQEDYKYLKDHDVKIASYLYIQAFMFNGEKADFSAYEIKM